MLAELVPDALWSSDRFSQLQRRVRRVVDRVYPDRACLTGILFVLRSPLLSSMVTPNCTAIAHRFERNHGGRHSATTLSAPHPASATPRGNRAA
jgi:hypothetical protein